MFVFFVEENRRGGVSLILFMWFGSVMSMISSVVGFMLLMIIFNSSGGSSKLVKLVI